MHIVNKLYSGSSQGLPFFMMPNLIRHSKFFLFSIKIYVEFLTLKLYATFIKVPEEGNLTDIIPLSINCAICLYRPQR